MRSQIPDPKSQIGCQGWNYPDWTTRPGGADIFYPRGTKPDGMLRLYARIFETIEVDSTFYAIPPAAVFEQWRQKTPAGFTFSLKLPQEITHELALREPAAEILEQFCERAAGLGEKLAAVLIQLPPGFAGTRENARNLRSFLARLPADIRFAIEFRHRDWLIDWTFRELEKRRVALCLVEGAWIPREMFFAAARKIPTPFVYIRFMGPRDLESFDRVARPRDANLKIWAAHINELPAAQAYVYFSNFYEGHAPASANKLKRLLGQPTVSAEELEDQGSLF